MSTTPLPTPTRMAVLLPSPATDPSWPHRRPRRTLHRPTFARPSRKVGPLSEARLSIEAEAIPTLNVEREWSTHRRILGRLGADVLIALACWRGEGRAGCRTFERLVDRANACRDLYISL